MTTPIESPRHDSRAVRPPAQVISGPWPSYAQFKNLPERERWVMYGSAKAYRLALEEAGFVMSESYSAFIARVTEELDI